MQPLISNILVYFFSQQAEEASPDSVWQSNSAQWAFHGMNTSGMLLIWKMDLRLSLHKASPNLEKQHVYLRFCRWSRVCSVLTWYQTDGWIATKLLAQQRKLWGKGVRAPEHSARVCSAGVDTVFNLPLTTENGLHGLFSSTMKDFGRARCSHMSMHCDVEATLRALSPPCQSLLKTSTQETYLITMFSHLICLSLAIGHSHWNVQTHYFGY